MRNNGYALGALKDRLRDAFVGSRRAYVLDALRGTLQLGHVAAAGVFGLLLRSVVVGPGGVMF